MKPLIYTASFIGHFFDAWSRKAAHDYAVSQMRLGYIHQYDYGYAVVIVLLAIVGVSAALAGVLK